MIWMTALLALAEPDLPPPDVAADEAPAPTLHQVTLRRTRTARDVGLGCAVGGPIGVLGGLWMVFGLPEGATTDVLGVTLATAGGLCTAVGLPLMLGAGYHGRALGGRTTRAWPATVGWSLALVPPLAYAPLSARTGSRAPTALLVGGYVSAVVVGGLWSEHQLRVARRAPGLALSPLMRRGEPVGMQISGRF